MSYTGPEDDKHPERSADREVSPLRRFGPAGVVLALTIVFIAQNTDSIDFEFLWFDFDASIPIVLVIFLGLGALLVKAIEWRRRRRKEQD
jgi:hypothetical protein